MQYATYPGPEHSNQPMSSMHVPMQQQQVVKQVVQERLTQQYLLATFAFFSVLNLRLALSYSHPTANPHHQHTHHGHVLFETPIGPYAVPVMPPLAAAPSQIILEYPTPDLVQAPLSFVSTMVLFYIVMPWPSDLTSHLILHSSSCRHPFHTYSCTLCHSLD